MMRCCVALAAGLLWTAPVTAQLAPHTWLGVDGEPLPMQTDAEIMEFLREADITVVRELSTGVTRPRQVLLRLGDVEAHAIFRDVDVREAMADFGSGGREMQFRDSAGFEKAAYELAQIVNLPHIPPVVQRRFDRADGTLQLWVEQAITEDDRLEQGRSDPAVQRWNRQLNAMNVFDVLIANTDRNRGNILIDPFWRLWFIDHTRAFRGTTSVDTSLLESIEANFWSGLQALDEASVRDRLGAFLTPREMNGLLGRAATMRDHFRELIRERGEARVVYTY